MRELTEDLLTEMYDEMLDECCGPVKIGTLEYSAAHTLKEVDPTAYRCGMVDYEDSLSQDGFTCDDCDAVFIDADGIPDVCDDCQEARDEQEEAEAV